MLGTNRTLVNPGTSSDEVARQAAATAKYRNEVNRLIRAGLDPVAAQKAASIRPVG